MLLALLYQGMVGSDITSLSDGHWMLLALLCQGVVGSDQLYLIDTGC